VQEDHGAVFVGVLIDGDLRLRPGQQPRQARLALAQRQRPQILALRLQQVERLQDGRAHRAMAMQGVEDRYAIISADHGLAVQGERLALILAAALAIAG
jgi:hypothetical protein